MMGWNVDAVSHLVMVWLQKSSCGLAGLSTAFIQAAAHGSREAMGCFVATNIGAGTAAAPAGWPARSVRRGVAGSAVAGS